MHYHLPQRNSMTVPRVDAYALAVDGYGINAGQEALKRIGDITTCSGSCNCSGMCGPMVTFVLDKNEDWEQRLGHRQHQARCWSDRELSARQNIPDSSPAWTKPWWPYRRQQERVSATVSQLPVHAEPKARRKKHAKK